MPPPETLLGTAELWSPTARGGGWATAAALLLLLLSVLLLLHRRCLLRPETSTASGSGTGVERLVTEDDLRQLVSSLGVGAREPERESWVGVIAKGNDAVSDRAWCDKTTESERAERATLVTQEKLQLATNTMKLMRLPDLWIRPVFGGRGRKLSGTLEAHVNGFRYYNSRSDERVDIMYGNIKHAFFQPTEKEMITLLHFHLHNLIMVGNMKTKDVQFYVEVMDVLWKLGGSRISALDPDKIEEEQRERDLKNRINMEFQNFVNKVNDHWSQPQFKGLDLEFDMPVRELGFLGVPYKASAFINPTSACLVELIESPFLVVTLSEIEIVNLERVGFGQKNIDMAIVFKDFKKDVLRIDSIPSTSLDSIKEWLDTTDLKYYESRLNLNWRPILKTITDDPQKFVDDGGWEFLNMEGSESESEGTEESDQGYEPSDAEPESDSEEEDSDSESLVESDEDDEDDSGEESEEKGKTCDELEREASHADREKGAESDSEEERRRRKVKTFSKSHPPERSNFKGPPPKRPKFR